MTSHGMVWYGMVAYCRLWWTIVNFGMVGIVSVQWCSWAADLCSGASGMQLYFMVRYDLLIIPDMVLHGMVWYSRVWYGMVAQ